ncbi:hypothetical protein FOZ62_026774 [Perkinsus olseni]|uniref:Uncharacterized protein n=1 Tax=Perkinsus olseni TaxID=32597 RepID=A0A7J6Q3L2_PEROL|nr:hypothetical protein FOZ62_026774 [Perkinsus olseni]
MTPTARRMSARLSNSRTSSQASSPVNLSPRVDDSAVGPNGMPRSFAAEKRVASPAADVCGPQRKSQRLASRIQPENDVLVENHGSEDGSGKSESSRSSESDTWHEDSGHEQPDERARRLERRRAGIPASAAEVKVEEQDAQRYPKRERIEISRFEPEPVYPRHMRKAAAHHRGGDTRRKNHGFGSWGYYTHKAACFSYGCRTAVVRILQVFRFNRLFCTLLSLQRLPAMLPIADWLLTKMPQELLQ